MKVLVPRGLVHLHAAHEDLDGGEGEDLLGGAQAAIQAVEEQPTGGLKVLHVNKQRGHLGQVGEPGGSCLMFVAHLRQPKKKNTVRVQILNS